MAYKTALIVDDSKLARVTLRKKLQSYGIDVAMAESGAEAVAAVQQNRPEIVFMDHLMPEMDGFEATQAIRQLPGFENLPIIMCTGKEHDGYLQEAQAIGANQILSKPPVDEALAGILATEFVSETVVHESPAETEEALAATDLLDGIPEFDSAVVEENMDDVFAEATLVSAPETQPVPSASEVPAKAPDAIAQALDEARLQALCKDVLDAERPALRDEILAAIPKPEMPAAPELDMQAVRNEVERLLEQKLADVLPSLTANIQQQMSGEFEALLNERISTLPPVLSAAEIGGLVDGRLKEALAGVERDVDAKLLALESGMSQSLQATQASAEGLVAEALQQVEQTSGNDIELQVDRLYQQQAVLSRSLKGSKALALVCALLGVAAMGSVAFLHFMQ